MILKKLLTEITLVSLIAIGGCTAKQQATQPPAQTPSVSQTTPKTQTPATTQVSGASLYASNCANCHGANGTGGPSPQLNTSQWKDSSKVQDVIRRGKGSMPSYQNTLNDTQIKAIGDYVASLK